MVHDFAFPERSIIAIANGSLTGRTIGGTLDALGFQLLKTRPASDLINYRAKTKSGKELRSSSVFLRDEAGEITGSLCINVDISALIAMKDWVQNALGSANSTVEEHFERSVDEVLDSLIRNALLATEKATHELTREDKVAVVAYLESRGAFLIRYSVERVAEVLGLTKYTIYNYLDEIRNRQDAGELQKVTAG